MPYDPVKAHAYYEAHKHLKGRRKGSAKPTGGRVPPSTGNSAHDAQQRSIRLAEKLRTLQNALKEALDELRLKEAALRRDQANAKKNSDGKSTAKEKLDAKKYRDKHKTELANKAKQQRAKGGSSSGSSASGQTGGVKSMNIAELKDRVSKIRGLISDAKSQLREANSLSHSALVYGEDSLNHDGFSGR